MKQDLGNGKGLRQLKGRIHDIHILTVTYYGNEWNIKLKKKKNTFFFKKNRFTKQFVLACLVPEKCIIFK